MPVICVPRLLTVTPSRKMEPSVTIGALPNPLPDTNSTLPSADVVADATIGTVFCAAAVEGITPTQTRHSSANRIFFEIIEHLLDVVEAGAPKLYLTSQRLNNRQLRKSPHDLEREGPATDC